MPEMEKNIISEADLEKAAGGLKISPETLKKGLISLGILTAGAGLGVGGYIVTNKVREAGGIRPFGEKLLRKKSDDDSDEYIECGSSED